MKKKINELRRFDKENVAQNLMLKNFSSLCRKIYVMTLKYGFDMKIKIDTQSILYSFKSNTEAIIRKDKKL